jgi:hypothetical protein
VDVDFCWCGGSGVGRVTLATSSVGVLRGKGCRGKRSEMEVLNRYCGINIVCAGLRFACL